MEVIVGKTNSKSVEKMSEEITNMARKVDIIINIGQKDDYYANIAYNLSLRECGNAMLVENMDDLYLNYIKRFRKVGIIVTEQIKQDTIDNIKDILENTKTEGYIYERFK